MKSRRSPQRFVSFLLALIMAFALLPAAVPVAADGITTEIEDPDFVDITVIIDDPNEDPGNVPEEDTDYSRIWEGGGISSNPFKLKNAVDLKVLMRMINDGDDFAGYFFELVYDVSGVSIYTGVDWNENRPFAGTLDGNGHSVDFTQSGVSGTSGLFGVLTGTVKNLTVGVQITGTGYIGGVAGKNYGTISNCTFTGSICASGNSQNVFGGIAGYSSGKIVDCVNRGTVADSVNNTSANCACGGIVGVFDASGISNCHNEGDVTGPANVGGIAGRFENTRPTISGCTNSGTVSGKASVGGIAGSSAPAVTVTRCRNDGAVKGNNDAGGIFGYCYRCGISNCVNNGKITNCFEGSCSNLGGIVGRCDDSNIRIEDSSNTGKVKAELSDPKTNATDHFGGIIGSTGDRAAKNIIRCYNTGEICCGDFGGGIAGEIGALTVDRCFNLGKICTPFVNSNDGSADYHGGLAGKTYNCTFENCFNKGVVIGRYYVGGIAGAVDMITLINNYNVGMVVGRLHLYGMIFGLRNGEVETTCNFYIDLGDVEVDGFEYECPDWAIGSGSTSHNEYEILELTESEFKNNTEGITFHDFDFKNVWYMGNYGPGLRGIASEAVNGVVTINSVDDLRRFRDNVNRGITYKDVTVKLAADVDLENEGHSWVPIAHQEQNSKSIFSGTFDGQNHRITGLNLIPSWNTDREGFFGKADGTIKNLRISGFVRGYRDSGGIVGYLNGGTVQNCYFSGTVYGASALGGIAGYVDAKGTVSKCAFAGSVEIYDGLEDEATGVGGIAGEVSGQSTVEYCTVESGTVSGGAKTGGIVGILETSTIKDCSHSGDVDGGDEDCVGGIVGYMDSSADVINCCHCSGTVSGGARYVAGIAGRAASTSVYGDCGVSYCRYLSGTVSVIDVMGNTSATDIGIGQTNSVTAMISNSQNTAFALTASAFTDTDNFTDWDFAKVWAMGESHPMLRNAGATVKFDAQGGSGTMADYIVPAFGGTLPACSFTRAGYEFYGWSTNYYLRGTYLPDCAEVDGLRDMTLYAVWIARADVSYINAEGSSAVAHDCIRLDDIVELASGWYYTDGNSQYTSRIQIHGDVNIILKDGSYLRAFHGIHVPAGSTLTIWGQGGVYSVPGSDAKTRGTGVLVVENFSDDTDDTVNAAIGGDPGETPGDISIYGGVIEATAEIGAAIGGAKGESGGIVYLRNCSVTAKTRYGGSAAIGGGYNGDGGNLTIRDSYVSARGSYYDVRENNKLKDYAGPAIGAGAPEMYEDGSFASRDMGTVTIVNSYVIADAGGIPDGGVEACAIGTSLLNDCDLSRISLVHTRCPLWNSRYALYEDIPYYCTQRGIDLEPCTSHAGSANDPGKCRWCGTTTGYGAVFLIFNYNYDNCPAPYSYGVDGGGTFTFTGKPQAPDGYFFKCWNTAANGSGETYLPGQSATLRENLNVYAQWGVKKDVSYVDASGDVKTASAGVLTEDVAALWDGWYVAEGELTYGARLAVSGDVHLILADDCTMTANAGIGVPEGSSLTIYGQQSLYEVPGETVRTVGTGVLFAKTGSDQAAAIGGAKSGAAGTITINGGVITARGNWGAGIGGGDVGTCGTVNINDGFVTASGNNASAGIGGGGYSSGGTVNISGGYVVATGSSYKTQAAPGIGSGRPRTNGSDPLFPGVVNITGGTVIAAAGPTPEGGIGAQAIGVNLADAANASDDSLILSDGLRVTSGESAETANVCMFADRTAACRGAYTRIEVCAEHSPDALDAAHCAYCGKEVQWGGDDVSVTGISLSLEGDIGVNFYLDLTDEQAQNAKVDFKWTVNGKQKTASVDLSTAEKTANGYKATCRVAPAEMTAGITVTVTVGDAAPGESVTVSVKRYADVIMNNSAFGEAFVQFENEAGGDGEAKLEKLRQLVADMLAYGAAAQEQFGVNTQSPANAGVDERYARPAANAADITVNETDMTADLAAYGLEYVGSSLICKTTASLRHYYRITDRALFDAVKGSVAVDSVPAAYRNAGGMIFFEIAGIAADELDTYFTLTIGSTDYQCSAMNYVKAALCSDAVDDAAKAVCTALWWYNQSAKAYIAG